MYRLLIVDEENSCKEIKSLLNWQTYGFSVVSQATSYADAVSKALDLNPSIALVSVKIGQHQGYELVERLRTVGLKTVFCMLSDSNDPQAIRRSMQAGAQDYLLKPLSVRELQAFVEKVVVNDLGGVLPELISASNDKIDPILHVEYSKLSKITNKIILIVKSDYRSSQTLSGIAKSLNMSSKYIGRVFLKDTGIKFSEYLMTYRMLEARWLIVNTQEKISVISGMVGYSQLNNFYVHFKNYFGASPGAFRNFEDTGIPEKSVAGKGGQS